ncbi:MAG TPA: hypothetical protein VN577_09145 [Terriglobales bacterium]|nr:hypothetical protein [Terriglobales bacterium]
MLSTVGIVAFMIGAVCFVAAAIVWYKMAEWEFRSPFYILCPETEKPAEITVDAKLAAHTRFAGHEEIRITSCSRWPDRRACNQDCSPQVQFVGDTRSETKIAPFGLQPDQLRINNPVHMTRELYKRIQQHH